MSPFEGITRGLVPWRPDRLAHPPTKHLFFRQSWRLRFIIVRYRIGRFLQVLGMIILPFGIASELMGKVGLGQSMLIAAGGTLLFYAGYVIQNQT